MKRRMALAWFLFGSALMLIPFTVFLKASASDSRSKAEAPVLARLGDRVTVHAQGRGAPTINLADGREALAAYAGEPEAKRLLQQNLVQPLAMASADLDEDGVPDLVSGYAAPNGGMLTLHRGNVDSIYPNTPEAQQRKSGGAFTDAPFLSPARAFETPRPVDFVGCGDFDADGHWDVVTAARGGYALHFFLGDGHGNLSAVRQLELSGTVTALATGEINRADGLTDLVVGIAAAGGPQALVFEGPEGALRANPEAFALPVAATAMILGRLDDDYTADLVVAAGSDLLVVYGRDRRLSLDESKQAEVPKAIINRRSFPSALKSVAIGDFTGRQHNDLALLAGDGTVRLLKAKAKKQKAKGEKLETESETLMGDAWPGATKLLCARVSSLPADSLVVVDSADHQLHIVVGNTTISGRRNAVSVSAPLDVEGEPVAVLPMRLNTDAISDLVILRRGQVAPTVTITAPALTFTVSNTGDNGGINPAPNADTGTLRQAIVDANANAGADTINFSIGSGQQTINLLSFLPDITEAATIDGTTQPEFAGTPLIELNGSSAGSGSNGISITSSGSTVLGLVINRFTNGGSGAGIFLSGAGGNSNLIQGNFIGTDAADTAALGNFRGVFVTGGSNNNTIGGTTSAARNVISGNTSGGIDFTVASGNTVQGNYVGTKAAGTGALGNGIAGVRMNTTASNNTIGGTAAGAGNLISGNTARGIGIGINSSGNMVQGNLVGTQANGTAALGNGFEGVFIVQSSSNNTIGGTGNGAGNTIAFNGAAGVFIDASANDAILSNSIYDNGGPGIALNGGANNNQAAPTLSSASSAGGNTSITGTLTGVASAAYNVQFFSNPACDASGAGEGQTFLGFASVTTDGSGNAAINATLPVSVAVGQVVTATATDPANNTSKFSQCVTVVAGGPVSDLQITKSDSPDPVASGSNIIYTMVVTNNGPDTDMGATFTDMIPTGTTFVSLSSPGTCSTPPVGGTGTVTCSLGALFPTQTVTITLVVQVTAASGSTITNTASISGMSTDPVSSNNSATATTSVSEGGGCTITCPPNLTTSNDPNQCGAVVTYPPPTTAGSCGTVTCAPISGSFFPKGTTVVTCNPADGPSCAFNVTVNDTQPPTITCPPNQTVAANVPSVVNYPPPTVSDNCPGVTAGCVPPSGSLFPVGTTTVTCTATDMSGNITGNTASCTFTVTVATCTITCPADVLRVTSPTDSSCGALVSYLSPTTSGACGTVNCAPPSGSFFNVGTATVTCTTSAGPSCSFGVTVVDAAPPTINCSTGVTAPLPAGQLSAVVNYPAATATDNCSIASVVCVPPSGSTFPAGSTLVTCTARDAFENSNRCFFFVTLLDGEVPVIVCPANVNASLPAGQTSAVVNYPAPTVTDNFPGVSFVCSPRSGSSFPAGTTTVTCTATDAGGNKSSCSFIVGLGGSQAKVTIPGNKTAVEFGTISPVSSARKPPKPKNNPCSFFTVDNIGFAPLVLTFDSISRTGSSVDSGRITDPNDTRFFSLSRVNSDQSLTPLDIGAVLTLQPGQVQNFCAKFAALIPALAGKTTGLAASNVLPDTVTSKIVFRQNAGANIAVPLLGRVSTGLVLVNLSNPRALPEVLFTKSGNDITVSYAVFDSNLDVSRAKYEFLDNGGQVVAGPFEIDLTASISSANLVRGQSFSVDQKFTGASSNPEVTGVRLTVFDGETSAGAPSTSSATSISAASVQLMNRARRVTLYPPDVKLR